MQLNQEQLHKKNEELIAMYREKCKKHTQMTNLYNLLKSRAMRSQMQTAASDSVSHTLNSLPGTRNADMISMNHGRPVHQSRQMPSSSRHFSPYQEDQHGIEQLHRHQRSGSGSSRGGGGLANTAAMAPPKRPFTTSKPFLSLFKGRENYV